ncbi:hypothetical protein ES703_118863 [subsurface metagenome]
MKSRAQDKICGVYSQGAMSTGISHTITDETVSSQLSLRSLSRWTERYAYAIPKADGS